MKVPREQLIKMIKDGKDVTKIDRSDITEIDSMFQEAKSFNQDIGEWNVSSVENMSSMFSHATSFKQNLDNWV